MNPWHAITNSAGLAETAALTSLKAWERGGFPFTLITLRPPASTSPSSLWSCRITVAMLLSPRPNESRDRDGRAHGGPSAPGRSRGPGWVAGYPVGLVGDRVAAADVTTGLSST